MNETNATPKWNDKFDAVFEKYNEMKEETGGKLQEYNVPSPNPKDTLH